MKKILPLILICVMLFCSCSKDVEETVEIQTPSIEYEKIISAYKDVLKDSQFNRYAVYDINKDKIPELFVANGDGGFSQCYIYTYDKGIIKISEEVIQYGFYKSSENELISMTGGTGVRIYSRAELVDNKLTDWTEFLLLQAMNPMLPATYKHEGKEVTEDEFKNLEPKDFMEFTDKTDLSVLEAEFKK